MKVYAQLYCKTIEDACNLLQFLTEIGAIDITLKANERSSKYVGVSFNLDKNFDSLNKINPGIYKDQPEKLFR